MDNIRELIGLNGTAFMDGLERQLRHAESKDVRLAEWQAREGAAREEARAMEGAKAHDGIGPVKRIIPAREFFRWSTEHEGNMGIWQDKKFLKDWDSWNPDLVVG